MDTRERRLDLDRLLAPRAIAVVGASPDCDRHPGRTVANLLRTGYRGRIVPVNPRYDEVMGLLCVPSVHELPDGVDTAYVLVRSALVAETVAACAAAGVAHVVVCTSGFAEEGDDGEAAQAELGRIAAATGVRVVGPNCIGIADPVHGVIAVPTLNIAPEIRPGRIAVVSQSGGMGVNVVNLAQARGLGIRAMVSLGNECDVDVADTLAAFADDVDTEVVALFVEQIRRPAAFLAAVAAVHAAGKRIVALKVGASEAGARSSLGHTGAKTGSQEVFTAVMTAAGVVVVDRPDELVDVAGLLAQPHRPPGNRLLVVSPSGGECSYVADRAAAAGLVVEPMSAETAAALRPVMRFGTPGNPLDLTGQVIGDRELLGNVMTAIAKDDAFDAVLVAVPTWTAHDAGTLLPRIAEATTATGKLVAFTAWSAGEITETAEQILAAVDAPSFTDVDAALRALRRLVELPPLPGPVATPDAVAVTRPAAWTSDPDEALSTAFFAAHGVPFPAQVSVAPGNDPVEAAADLRAPYVAKLLCDGVVHKSDLGLVHTGLADDTALAAAAVALGETAVAAGLTPVALLVAEQADGAEVIIGGVRDETFGPVVAVGPGGVLTELLGGTALAPAPVTVDQARDLVQRSGIGPLLAGFRGQRYDVEGLATVIAAASRVFADSPWLTSFDLNPVLVDAHGAVAVDAALTAAADVAAPASTPAQPASV